MRIFFATDLHGSQICFRKLCAAGEFYRCDQLIMGGDVTGKLVIPITLRGGLATYELGGTVKTFDVSGLPKERLRISNMGYYPVEGDEDVIAELSDPERYEDRLLSEAVERVREWVAFADDRLGSSEIRIHYAPGNDDPFPIDDVFEETSGQVFINCEDAHVDIDGYEMVTTGWANPTPWHTPRECTEAELEARLRELVEQVERPDRAIFNFHVPPFNTPLDLCPELDDQFRVKTVMGNPLMMHAGSTAVRKVIEEYQPMVSLHGHIHESRNTTRLGRTTAINPGSEYGEGILLGVILDLKKDRLKSTFTAG